MLSTWTVLSLLALAPAGLAAGDPRLEGPAALVASVTRQLGGRGIGVTSAGGATLHVQLYDLPTGIQVVLRDHEGRTIERVVATAEIAAALIESWSRPDLADPLLAPRASHPAKSPLAVRAVVAPPAPGSPAPASGVPVLRLAGETAVGSDGSAWLGAGLGGCVSLGRFCVGLVGRFASSLAAGAPRALYKETTPAQLSRQAFEGLATAELPIALGRPLLVLGAGLGVGRLATELRHEAFGRQVSSVSARAEVRAALALPVWARLLLDLEIAAAASPGTQRDQVTAGYFTAPGEPFAQLRLGLGVRWGTP